MHFFLARRIFCYGCFMHCQTTLYDHALCDACVLVTALVYVVFPARVAAAVAAEQPHEAVVAPRALLRAEARHLPAAQSRQGAPGTAAEVGLQHASAGTARQADQVAQRGRFVSPASVSLIGSGAICSNVVKPSRKV